MKQSKSKWYSTPASARRAKPKNLTLSPEAHEALARLAERAGESESAAASRAITEQDRRETNCTTDGSSQPLPSGASTSESERPTSSPCIIEVTSEGKLLWKIL